MSAFKPLVKRSVVPAGGYSMAQALNREPTLGSLLAQHRAAQACMNLAANVLGPGLSALVRAGPLQEGEWVILADSGQVAAKVKHFLPRVLSVLQSQGHPVREVKLRVAQRNA